MTSFFGELRRRNVVKVAAAYAIVAWLLIQVTATVFPILQIPGWATALVTMLVLLGFPVALLLSWAFELTPEGLKPTKSVPQTQSVTRATGQKLNYVVIALLAVALIFVIVDSYFLGEPSSTDRDRSIAVLPFENQSAAEENAEFIADGIHGELITQLFKIGALDKVISRTSVMDYRDTQLSLREIGQALGVANLLVGIVQQAGNRLRINVTLIDVATDGARWSELYDAELTAANIFEIQRDMATSIAAALQATLSPQEVDRLSEIPTESAQAWNYYQRGMNYLWRTDFNTFTPRARDMFETAVELDDNFALAWAALSRARSRLYWQNIERTEATLEAAELSLNHAFGIEADLPEAHLARGVYHYMGFNRFNDALEEFEIAERDLPNPVELLIYRADVLQRLGYWEDARDDYLRAIESDPRNFFLHWRLGDLYVWLREYDEADRSIERALAIAPTEFRSLRQWLTLPLHSTADTARLRAEVARPSFVFGEAQLALYGWVVAIYERDYSAALRYLDDIVVEDITVSPPGGLGALEVKEQWLGYTYELRGESYLAAEQYERARILLGEMLDTNSDNRGLQLAYTDVLAALGEPASVVRQRLTDIDPPRDDRTRVNELLDKALILARIGDIDSAVASLDEYLTNPGPWSLDGLLASPRLRDIQDPTFLAFVARHRSSDP